jgi:hypothetical protein
MSPRRSWDSPTPSLASECAPPPGTKGGGGILACGCMRGWGVPIPTTGEKLSTLPILCEFNDLTQSFMWQEKCLIKFRIGEFITYSETYDLLIRVCLQNYYFF